MTPLDMALERSAEGDYRPMVALQGAGDAAALAARGHLHLLAPTRFEAVQVEELTDAAEGTHNLIADYASIRALLVRDQKVLQHWSRRAPGSLAPAWTMLSEGRYDDAANELATHERPTRSESRAFLLVVRSEVHLALGERDEALDAARSAARIARTDGGRVAQCLTYLHLSRVRRACAQRHRALRILGSLQSAASPLWQPRIAWELALAAAPDEHSALGRLLLAGGGPAPALTFATDRADCSAIRAALEPDATPDAVVGPYLEGAESLPPPPLAGVCGSTLGQSRSLLLVMPERCRRVCLWAEAKCAERAESPEIQGRTALAIATLALAPERALSRELFFARVYGQAYDQSRHRNVVKTLAHRMRGALGDVADLSSEDGFSLIVRRPFWLQDPTGETSIEEQVLAELATKQGARVAAVSKSLGLSRRSVQNATLALSEKGVIRKRDQAYVVVDTTFTEPTHWPSPLPSDET